MASIDNENEDSWLYDNDVLKDTLDNSTDNNQTERDELEKLEAMEDSDDKGVNGVKAETNDATAGDVADTHETDFMDGEDITNNHQNDDDDDVNNKSDYDDSGDDDVQVTLRDIKEIYDKYPGPPGAIVPGAPISLPVVNSTKPPSKGVDVDAIGNVKGVQIYEYDLNNIKIDEKPWRKPGADITDYFNYGFTEDTWMKYCEKQRRLRLENNCRSGLIVGNGQIAGDSANDLDATYLGMNRRQSSQRMTGIGPGTGGTPKQSGVIDVIGGTQRDSRRPQQEFTEVPTSQSPATSVATVMPISMSIPPPMLNMPPPDFAIPPPSSLPPGALGHPVIGPPGIIGHPPILVAPPPNFAPPPLAGQFDPFFRPPMIGGPPPTAVNHSAERRGVPGFPDRPPFRMESIFGAPPAFQGPTGMPPPHWDSRKVPLHSEDRPPQWGRSGSRSRESEISSSSTEETGRKSREKYEASERKSPAYSRGDSRHRSRDRSRRREYDRDRSTHERDRRRDYEMSRSSRHHSRHRGYRDEERSSRHYSSRSSRREKSPHDDYRSGSRYSSRKHRHERSRSSSSSSEKERRKSSSSPDHKK